MQMLLTGALLGFIIRMLLADDLAERKIRYYLDEKRKK
jgi:hypothetical protein